MGVRGRSDDRVNHGRLGPKGLHGWEANNSSDRLKVPLIRRGNRFIEASWDEAMNLIVSQSKNIRDRHTSSAIGFYTSGQLFLEEYYTLAVIGKAGLGTPHMDGNTRLCTATAAAALKESFGTDGQPGSYTDLDTTDAIFDVGHNMAEQQTVLWTRVLDRLAGPRRPKLLIMDPRPIPAAKEADVHLAPKPGTNVVVLNGLLRLIIQNGWISRAYIDAHTMGFEEFGAHSREVDTRTGGAHCRRAASNTTCRRGNSGYGADARVRRVARCLSIHAGHCGGLPSQ